MALAELQREDLEPIERFPRLVGKGTKLIKRIQTSIVQRGSASTAFLIMMGVTALKMTYSCQMPPAWWIILGILTLNELGLFKAILKHNKPEIGVLANGQSGKG